jgi:hypothetical protein
VGGEPVRTKPYKFSKEELRDFKKRNIEPCPQCKHYSVTLSPNRQFRLCVNGCFRRKVIG